MQGEITWPPPAPKLSAAPAKKPAEPAVPIEKPEPKQAGPVNQEIITYYYRSIRCFTDLGNSAPAIVYVAFHSIRVGLFCRLHGDLECHPFTAHTLNECDQCSEQYYCHWRTDTNLIFGIYRSLVAIAAFGVLITSINIAGGFAVTQRMLQMFRK